MLIVQYTGEYHINEYHIYFMVEYQAETFYYLVNYANRINYNYNNVICHY